MSISNFISISKFNLRCAIVMSAMIVGQSCMTAVTDAQLAIRFGGGRVAIAGEQVESNPDAESGAILKTSPDLEGVLETAERIRKDGNYRVATQLWQEVLKQSGDALFSPDGSTYFSLGQQIEAILAGLPPEGLTAYRVTADAAAKEILAQVGDPTDVTALNTDCASVLY